MSPPTPGGLGKRVQSPRCPAAVRGDEPGRDHCRRAGRDRGRLIPEPEDLPTWSQQETPSAGKELGYGQGRSNAPARARVRLLGRRGETITTPTRHLLALALAALAARAGLATAAGNECLAA